MLIYKDIFSDDELSSDTYPTKVVDEVILEFTGKYEVRKEGAIVLAGSNPSAEGEDADDGEDESVQRGIDIVLNHQLVEMQVYCDPKAFKEYLREYMKRLADKLKEKGMAEDDLKEWKTKVQGYFGPLVKKERFKNLQFFSGPGDNACDGQLGILEYRDFDDGEKPIMIFVRAGLEEEKC